ncbi:DinB family protein [Deinococcus sp. YIM 134068]|uniref:DinB family protein n=1 Tax=Deinococcus lichenicola TaxID=3118910 RepID=UPI002F93A873
MTVSREDWKKTCLIEPAPGYTPHIGVLVAMMNYARLTTLQAVGGLSVEELDAIPPGFSNSIGMLLAHIAAVDRLYQRLSFENRGFDKGEMAVYGGAISFGQEGERVRGFELGHYLDDLEAARADTLAELARRDDTWLASNLQVPDFDYPNHHWAWFHVMEDEVSHRGQIRIIRKVLEAQTQG